MSCWPEGVGCLLREAVASTNLEGRRIADEITGPTWILARVQTRGRGRQDRKWVSLAGNLHATLVMPLPESAETAALRSFIAALALRDSLAAETGQEERFRLKWPNDVLLDGGKVAGMLLETAGSPARRRLLIGVGVNLAAAPQLPERDRGAPAPVCLQGCTGKVVQPESFLARLAGAYSRRESQFLAGGFEPIRREWLQHAAGLGREATFRMARNDVRGVFETIDTDGCAVVLADGIRQRVAAADMLLD